MEQMALIELCKRIHLPEPVMERVSQSAKELNLEEIQPYILCLYERTSWREGLAQIKKLLSTEDEGIQMLTVLLIAALGSYHEYQKRGIGEEIFTDTFACFTRFVKEHEVSYQSYGFDREWWTVRQLSLTLFRIGTLEYEIIPVESDLELSLHIPSDSILTMANCRSSYETAKRFFEEYYPEVNRERISCESWLLAPGLQKVLAPGSKIRKFQQAFEVTKVFPEDEGYREWAYQRCNLPVNQLPERTSLQRNLKRYLMEGNQLGSAFGYLKENPFLD